MLQLLQLLNAIATYDLWIRKNDIAKLYHQHQLLLASLPGGLYRNIFSHLEKSILRFVVAETNLVASVQYGSDY